MSLRYAPEPCTLLSPGTDRAMRITSNIEEQFWRAILFLLVVRYTRQTSERVFGWADELGIRNNPGITENHRKAQIFNLFVNWRRFGRCPLSVEFDTASMQRPRTYFKT